MGVPCRTCAGCERDVRGCGADRGIGLCQGITRGPRKSFSARYTEVVKMPYNSAMARTWPARSGRFAGRRSNRCRSCSSDSGGMAYATRMASRSALSRSLYSVDLEIPLSLDISLMLCLRSL